MYLWLVVLAVILGIVANYRIWALSQSQTVFSRIMVDQIKAAHDAIHDVKAINTTNSAPVTQMAPIVKDPWSYASKFINFVQNAKPGQLRAAYDMYAGVGDADAQLLESFNPEVDSDVRLAKALAWSNNEDDVNRIRIVGIIRLAEKVEDYVVVQPFFETKLPEIPIEPEESNDAPVAEIKVNVDPEPTQVVSEIPRESVHTPKKVPKTKKRVASKKNPETEVLAL